MRGLTFDVRSLLILLLLPAAPRLFGQTITITGHVNGTQGQVSALCNCMDKDKGTVRIELRKSAWIGGGAVIYPFSVASADRAIAYAKVGGAEVDNLSASDFKGNSLRIAIASKVWKSDFDYRYLRFATAKRAYNDILSLGTFNRLDSVGVSVSDQNGKKANVAFDLYDAGGIIWSVISKDKITPATPLAPGYFEISSPAGTFALIVDSFKAEPIEIAPIGVQYTPTTPTTAQNTQPPPPSEPQNPAAAAILNPSDAAAVNRLSQATAQSQPTCSSQLGTLVTSSLEERWTLFELYDTSPALFELEASKAGAKSILKLATGVVLACVADQLIVAMSTNGNSQASATQEAQNIANKAASTQGNKGEVASSRQVAEDAANKFLGPNTRPIYDRSGSVVIGKISLDGERVVRYTSVNKPNPYINLENKPTGGNLHVSW